MPCDTPIGSRAIPTDTAPAQRDRRRLLALGAGWLAAGSLPARAQAWEPTAPVEIVVPAGTGGGADQMARLIQTIVQKHSLMRQPITVVNRAGDSGAEGLLDVKAAAGNPHKLLITLSSLFTTPMSTGIKFSWRDLTPVSMMALDQFVLWVPADAAFRSTRDAVAAVGNQPPGTFKLGGTGVKQEDQLLAVLFETAAGKRLTYVPLRGGGDVARALAAKEVDFTVNNPIEAEALWREGRVRPLCVFDGERLAGAARVAGDRGWPDLPTCMSEGVPAQYLMLRGVFAAGGITAAQTAYYQGLLARVRQQPEWREFLQRGAFKDQSLSGPAFVEWLDRSERFHRVLMREARLMAR
jgi:tripartite-type tricarboxylate transporter receptor subunit TctC